MGKEVSTAAVRGSGRRDLPCAGGWRGARALGSGRQTGSLCDPATTTGVTIRTPKGPLAELGVAPVCAGSARLGPPDRLEVSRPPCQATRTRRP